MAKFTNPFSTTHERVKAPVASPISNTALRPRTPNHFQPRKTVRNVTFYGREVGRPTRLFPREGHGGVALEKGGVLSRTATSREEAAQCQNEQRWDLPVNYCGCCGRFLGGLTILTVEGWCFACQMLRGRSRMRKDFDHFGTGDVNTYQHDMWVLRWASQVRALMEIGACVGGWEAAG